MIGGTALRATAIGLRLGVRLGVRPRQVAGIAAREGRLVVGLNGEVNGAMIAGIAGLIAVATAARGRTGAGDHERSSREPPIAASRGSTGTSGRRSRRRTG